MKWWLIGAAAAMLSAAAGTVLLRLRPAEKPLAELTPVRITSNPPESPVGDFALSPDGKYLLYVDTSGVHLRSVDTGDSRLIPDTKGVDLGDWGWNADGTRMILTKHGPTQPENFSVSPLGGPWHPLGNVSPFRYGKYALVISIFGFQLKAADGTLFPLDRPGGRRLMDGVPNRKVLRGHLWNAGGGILDRGFRSAEATVDENTAAAGAGDCGFGVAFRPEADLFQLNELWTLELNPDTGLPADPPRLRSKSWDANIVALSASDDGKRLFRYGRL